MSVIKTSTKAPVEILPFHTAIYTIARAQIKATETNEVKMRNLVTSRYGATAPTFEQYKLDLKALDQLARDKGLTDGQWLRRPYCAALKALYKALPESQAPEAIAKREQRAQRDKLVKEALEKAKAATPAAPVGAPKGETQERVPSEEEQREQLIARMGVWETLYACLRILETDEVTKDKVVHMRKQADKLHDACNAADKAARAKAIVPQS